MHLHSAAHALSTPSRCFKFDAVLLHSNLGRLRRNYLSEIPADINVLSCGPNPGIKILEILEILNAIYPADINKNLRAFATRDGAIWSKNRKIISYHRDSPNTRNGAC